MRNWLILLTSPWLLVGCVLDCAQLPWSYRPDHVGATVPLADGAAFKGIADPKKETGEVTLHCAKPRSSRSVCISNSIELANCIARRLSAWSMPAHLRSMNLGALD